MAFTAQDVKDLRDLTGVGMMDCKKALTDSDGNIERAVELLREKGLAAATKKAGRVASDGIVWAVVDTAKKVGAIVEVNSETDFVAKNEGFKEFVAAIAQVVIDANPADEQAILACKIGDLTVEAALQEKILTIGENIKIRRFTRYEGDCIAYIHGGGTHGVLVKFDTDVADKEGFVPYAKDIAMQIAAANPLFVKKEEVSADTIEKEKEILLAQAINEGKPQAIAEKMVLGRISKYYKENCLIEQQYVKDPDITVDAFTKATAKSLGGDIKIDAFTRYEKGEGLEKKEDNFADEVASMIK